MTVRVAAARNRSKVGQKALLVCCVSLHRHKTPVHLSKLDTGSLLCITRTDTQHRSHRRAARSSTLQPSGVPAASGREINLRAIAAASLHSHRRDTQQP